MVLPVPGGPHRIIEWSWPSVERAAQELARAPIRCGWPTTSSSVRGRIRSASGPGGGGTSGAGGSKRSTAEYTRVSICTDWYAGLPIVPHNRIGW